MIRRGTCWPASSTAFRVSVLFGFTLTALASAIGILAGAVQGYYGGLTDLLFQRFIEIWSGLPDLFMLIILSSIIAPSFWVLLLFLLLFNWINLTGVVRAEFLRGRTLDYVRAPRRSASPTSRSCAGTSCPTPWSPRSPSCPSRFRAR